MEMTGENVEKRNHSMKKLWIAVSIIVAVIIVGAVGYFCFFKTAETIEVTIKNTDFHEIEVAWTSSKKEENYEVIIASEKFTQSDVMDKLKAGSKLDSNYKITTVHNDTKATLADLLSNTDYYLMVMAYRENNSKKTYSNPSDVIEIHTQALEIGKITDLSADEVTDKSIKLKWTEWTTEEKNLDNTDIEITYTLFSVDKKDGQITEIEAGLNTNEYTITDLTPFTTYQYKIVINAVVDGNTVSGAESEMLEVMTKAEAITGVAVTGNTTSAITITWDKYEKTGSATYSVYGSDNDSDYALLAENITDTTYTESGLTENKTRYYYVVANITIDDNQYESVKGAVVSGTTNKSTNVAKPNSGTGSSANRNPSSGGNSSQGGSATNTKDAQARAVAQQIANSITGNTDLEKISKAAEIVSEYYRKGVHVESGSDYYTAYGVFIKGESSCAGTTRALGMVLEYMGYSWTHANENQWKHQWVIVTMDGQVGWADGQIGWAGYGEHFAANQ